MPAIVLTETQLHILATSREPVDIRDPHGQLLGRLHPDAALIAEAKQRRQNPQPGIPAEKVQACLRALEKEWERTGGFSEEHLQSFLAQWKAGEAS